MPCRRKSFHKDLSEFNLNDTAYSLNPSPRAEYTFCLTENLDEKLSVCIQAVFGGAQSREAVSQDSLGA